MGNNDDLFQSRDGSAIKELATQGDNEARVDFADLVLYRGYEGARKLLRTKRATRKKAIADALRFIDEAADAGHFRALRFRAHMNLHGVPDPRADRVIRDQDFRGAERDYKALLSHTQCSDKDRGEFHLRLGETILHHDRARGHNRKEQALTHLRQAVAYPDHEAAARHILTGVLWRHSAYEEAVSHALSCYEDYPWAAMILHMAYRNGQGVEADTDLADWYYDYWEQTNQAAGTT
ncbi:MAG: hypothetical protein R6W87_06330 [Halospina sp.]